MRTSAPAVPNRSAGCRIVVGGMTTRRSGRLDGKKMLAYDLTDAVRQADVTVRFLRNTMGL